MQETVKLEGDVYIMALEELAYCWSAQDYSAYLELCIALFI